jgi:hypothetical protein
LHGGRGDGPEPAAGAPGACLELERVEQRARLEERERRGGHVLADELGSAMLGGR